MAALCAVVLRVCEERGPDKSTSHHIAQRRQQRALPPHAKPPAARRAEREYLIGYRLFCLCVSLSTRLLASGGDGKRAGQSDPEQKINQARSCDSLFCLVPAADSAAAPPPPHKKIPSNQKNTQAVPSAVPACPPPM